MIAFTFALFLLASPVISAPEASTVISAPDSPERELWWSSFWDTVTNTFNTIVDTAAKAWDALELDVVFPKLTDALEKVVESCKTTFADLGEGIQFIIDYSTSFWHDTTEGLTGKDGLEQIHQIIKNIDDIADCDFYTFEMLMDIKCEVDRPAFVGALEAIHTVFGVIVTLVDQGACINGVLPLEVEYDINITTEAGRASVPEFKKVLEQFRPEQESSLSPFLSESQPDATLSTEPSFCEAYDAGRQEFEEASENVKKLTEEVKELIEAVKEESKNVWSFFRRFINIWRKDPVKEKKEQKEAELQAAKKSQAHGADTILGASTMCANGTMRGPKRRDNGEPICSTASRRLYTIV